MVLAFPSDDFGKEEPDGNDAIKKFVAEKYKVTFPLFAKISLAGEHMAPLYQFLTDKQANPTTGGPIRWNFTKFLVDREGKVVRALRAGRDAGFAGAGRGDREGPARRKGQER